MTSKQRLFLFFALLYVAYMVFPMLADTMRLPVGTINIITFSVLLLINPNAFFNRLSLWTFLYLAVLWSYTELGKQLPPMGIGNYDSRRIMIIESANILPAFAIFQHLRFYNNTKLYKWIAISSIVLIGLSLLYIIPMAMSDNILLRKNEVRGEYHIFGMPSYALTHAYMLIIPGLIYGMKQQDKIKKVLLFISLVLVLLTIYYSYITTTFLISIALIALGLFYNEDNNKLILRIVSAIVLVVLVYSTGLFEWLLNGLVSVFDGTASQNKMIELRAMFMGQDIEGGVFDERHSLHMNSLKAFTTNVFLGDPEVGNHSTLLDRLGGLGLVGFIPFACMLWNQMRSGYSFLCDKECKYYYLLSIGAVLVYMYNKGLFGGEGWLFLMVLVPSILTAFSNIK